MSFKRSNECHLHRLVAKLSCFQKACNMLASKLSTLSCLLNDEAQFKAALKWYVSMHSFYSIDKVMIFKNGW
jgi:hypothetical protein